MSHSFAWAGESRAGPPPSSKLVPVVNGVCAAERTTTFMGHPAEKIGR